MFWDFLVKTFYETMNTIVDILMEFALAVWMYVYRVTLLYFIYFCAVQNVYRRRKMVGKSVKT